MSFDPVKRDVCVNDGGIYLEHYRDFGDGALFDQKSELCVENGQLDCKLISTLETIDKSGNADGCISYDEVQKKYPNLSAERIFGLYRVRADELDRTLLQFANNEERLADRSMVTRSIDLIGEIADVAALGYFVRDQEITNGPIWQFFGIISVPFLNIPNALGVPSDPNASSFSERYHIWDATDFADDYDKENLDERNAAIAQLMKELRRANELGDDVAVKAAIDGLRDKEIGDDLPIDLMQQLFDVKRGDIREMTQVLYAMGEWFEKHDNLVAAQYIFEQIKDNADIEAIADIARNANHKLLSMGGFANETMPVDTSFIRAIFPPMPWKYNDLSSREKFNFVRDWVGFGLSWVGASILFKASTGILHSIGSTVVGKSRWIQNIIAVNKRYSNAATLSASAESSAISSNAGRMINGIGKSLYWPFGAIKQGTSYVAGGISVAGKAVGGVVRSGASSPNLYVNIPSKVALGLASVGKTLLTDSVKAVKFLAKGKNVFGGYLVVRKYGNPFLPYPVEPGTDLSVPIVNDALADFEVDWAIQSVVKEASRQPMNTIETIYIKRLDRVEWEGTRRKQKRAQIKTSDKMEEYEKSDILNIINSDPLLNHFSIGYFGDDGIRYVRNDIETNFSEYSPAYDDGSLSQEYGNYDFLSSDPITGGEILYPNLTMEALCEGQNIFGEMGQLRTPIDVEAYFASNEFIGPAQSNAEDYNIYEVEMIDGERYLIVVNESFDERMRSIAGEDYLTGAFTS